MTSFLWASRPCAHWVLALNLVLCAATSDASAAPAPAATAATAAAPSDHPLLTRMPGYVIEDKKEEAFGARRFGGEGQVLPGTVRLPGGQIEVEGRVTEIAYIDEQERGSVLAIYRNHLHALASLGAQALNTGLSNAQIAQGGRFLFQLGQGPASRWVALDLGSDTYRYVLTIVEPAARFRPSPPASWRPRSRAVAWPPCTFSSTPAGLISRPTAWRPCRRWPS
ncbi:MAG: hypothetical protein O9341_10555 [Paucibacter sp.]|nr:hypothetical protein [Roseateles sp.]